MLSVPDADFIRPCGVVVFALFYFRLDSVYNRWWLNVRESNFSVCSELCPVSFPIVRECVSVLLYFVFGACVDCCDYGKVI